MPFDLQVIKEISLFMMHNVSDFDEPLTSWKESTNYKLKFGVVPKAVSVGLC
jgi:hypothetical protein